MGSISVTATRAPCPEGLGAALTDVAVATDQRLLPPIITSVARLMPSMSECRVPYLLSNFDLVTESLTLIAGKDSSPAAANW